MNIATISKKHPAYINYLLFLKKQVNVVFLMQCTERFVFLLFMYLLFTFCSVCIHTINYGIPSKN